MNELQVNVTQKPGAVQWNFEELVNALQAQMQQYEAMVYTEDTVKDAKADGSYVDAVTIGEGMDSGDKATNKAMAVAFKYACFQVFCIPTVEMNDPDGDTPDPIEPSQEAQQKEIDAANNSPIDKTKISVIRNTIASKGLKESSILEHYGVKSFEAMSFGMWNNAMQLLGKYPDKA